MVSALSALVSAACVLASARRLALAVNLTSLDPQLLAQAMERGQSSGLGRLCQIIEARAEVSWERGLLAALSAADEPMRVALVHEQLHELDWRAQRWVRVPRVCASIATSGGFLFACVALTGGLSLATNDAGAALVGALDALAIGVAGTSFCAAVHVYARRAVRLRLAATDRLVERFEAVRKTQAFPETHHRVPLGG
jgi:hypothetical protein